jgi:starch phosphorylase
VQRIKHYLIHNFGKLLSNANTQEFYQAFAHSLREEIMINWIATNNSIFKKKARIVYYFSMEYLPGKFIDTNITNMQMHPLIQQVLKACDRCFSELITSEPDPGLGNGGLGRLSSCFLESLASENYPAFGYGLRYQYGIFEQEIFAGKQVERPDCWLLNENPWEFRRDSSAMYIHFSGTPIPAINSHKDPVFTLEDYEEVRALPYDTPIIGYPKYNHTFSVTTLRLWSTKESPKNFALQRYNAGKIGEAGENTALTDVLYPNDNHEVGKRTRLKQEFLLVSSSIQDIIARHLLHYDTLESLEEKVRIHISDTHAALLIPELILLLTTKHDISFTKAWEITQQITSYTNHTILKEALEEWNEERIQRLLPRQYFVIQQLNHRFCEKIREKYPKDEQRIKNMSLFHGNQICMAKLCILSAHTVNGVAQLHSEILKNKTFADFHAFFPKKFTNVTNGISQKKWLLHANPMLANFLTEHIKNDWITDFTKVQRLHELATIPKIQQQFLEIKKQNKEKLIQYLHTNSPIRNEKGKVIEHFSPLPSWSLFDIHIKRIHEYKRQLMNLLHVIMLYFEIKENKTRNIARMVLLSGKAAPGYTFAKHIIQLAFVLAKNINHDPEVNPHLRIAFIENYNVSKAQMIIPAADLSEQISTAGMEASGTGNMKLAINGALTIATHDGANIEMQQAITKKWWPFSFGSHAEELIALQHTHAYNPMDIYIQHPLIRQTLDSLKNDTFQTTEQEKKALHDIHAALLVGYDALRADHYFVLKDLMAYYETQKKVETLYLDPKKWAEYALHNIASMGSFSADISIKNYAKNIWSLEPCTIDPNILQQVEKEYFEYDRCTVRASS